MLQTVFLYVVYFIAIRTLVPRIRQLSITGFTGFTKKKLSAPTSSPPSPSRTAPSRTLFDFDGEHAEVFRVMSEQHLHERGPWMRMKQFTEEYAAEKEGLQILDIATGSGEPGEWYILKSIPLGDWVWLDWTLRSLQALVLLYTSIIFYRQQHLKNFHNYHTNNDVPFYDTYTWTHTHGHSGTMIAKALPAASVILTDVRIFIPWLCI